MRLLKQNGDVGHIFETEEGGIEIIEWNNNGDVIAIIQVSFVVCIDPDFFKKNVQQYIEKSNPTAILPQFWNDIISPDTCLTFSMVVNFATPI